MGPDISLMRLEVWLEIEPSICTFPPCKPLLLVPTVDSLHFLNTAPLPYARRKASTKCLIGRSFILRSFAVRMIWDFPHLLNTMLLQVVALPCLHCRETVISRLNLKLHQSLQLHRRFYRPIAHISRLTLLRH